MCFFICLCCEHLQCVSLFVCVVSMCSVSLFFICLCCEHLQWVFVFMLCCEYLQHVLSN